MDTYFSQNLRFLRNNLQIKISQEKFAEEIDIKKSTISSYESGRAEPKYIDLVKLAKYYSVNIDDLLTKEFSQQSPRKEVANLRVLATTVNADNEENIEFVPIKAIAGYVSGFGDLEYISHLPVFQVPFLPKDKKYRVFPIQGDSMSPLKEGSLVFSEYVEDWRTIKNGTICVIVTKDEGVVLKKVFNYLQEKNVLVLKSTNEHYTPYPVIGEDIKELWKFVGYFSGEFPV